VEPDSTAADIEAIKTSFAELVAVAEAGDADGYLRYITDDAIYLGPGAEPVVGKEAIREFVAGFFADWVFSFPTWAIDEIVVSGNLAIYRYSAVATFTKKDGSDSFEEDRKYMDVFSKAQDGQWLLSRHMYNLNK
jgi:uncharacterized protein (TIGR02246 family)